MAGSDRYDTGTSPEGQHEPDSGEKVLRNKLGIKDAEQMELLEFDLLARIQDQLFEQITIDQQLTTSDLKLWHLRWLGSVYDWAGQYRTVNLSKQGFPFAAADQIERLMDDYQRLYLERWTPSCGLDAQSLATALAECHIEFILIHPFREGNGRLARLLATVMALQAGEPPLNFGLMESDQKGYISAIHAGHSGHMKPMIDLFSDVLEQSR